MSTARPNGTASHTSRNPKRRQRSDADDSVGLRQNPKRLRRSELKGDTFEPLDLSRTNGHVKHHSPLGNGHANASKQRDAASETGSLAIRNRDSKKVEREKRGSRLDVGTVLTKNDFYIVSQLPTTPDRFQNPQSPERWRGELYNNLGFALVTTQEYAVVWRYTQGLNSAEPLKPLTIRLLNPSTNPRQPLPLGILVPTSGEPALLVVNPTNGKVTYWESLSNAATGDSNRQKQHCAQGVVSGMVSGEVITQVVEGEPHGFALALSSGRVAHVSISDPQGKPMITTRFLRSDGAQSVGIFGGLKSVFGSAGRRRDIAAVRAGYSAHRGHRQLVVVTSKGTFQVWDLNWNGSQSLLCEIEGKADLLKSLVEGGDVFRDRHDHRFEVLDFAFSPVDLESKEPIQHTEKGDCQLWVLTALHGTDSSRYNLLGLTLADGSLTINVVHPLSCYKSPLPSDSQFKPQVLVPERGFAAFVAFEKSIVLISLIEVEESPSSQLKVEAHTLPDPFQDSIEFKKTKPYRNLACAAESADGAQSSSCVFMVHGFGAVRFLALPMQKGQSAVDRATVTAATKIEQAVFFGKLPQDLLDFSGRPELAFSQEQIERAAEGVSDSILKGESKYIPREMPSMEAQLQRRAVALEDLIRHLRQRYGSLGRSTRWRLLWDAEKVAAAEAMWRAYQATFNAPKKESGYRNFLAEVVETCSETYKIENRPEKYETDGVRHYFMNDIWRVERLVPYIDRTVQEMLDENAENEIELDMATHARYLREAADFQIAALDTAFRFREINLRSYDLAGEATIDGVLLQGYEDLDEPWTSTGHVSNCVKDLAGRSLKFVEDAEESEQENHPAVAHVKKNLPQQIQLFNQTQIEQFRWLKAHPEQRRRTEGEALQEEYFGLRKHLFSDLAVVGCIPEAIQLAEKYEDMEALVGLMEVKRADILDAPKPQVSEDGKATLEHLLRECDEQIVSYFTKYGVHWADAYFSKQIANKCVTTVLEQSPMYQKALTAFLRRKPQYSKIRWINEVTAERNYAAAAESLRVTQDRETRLWFKKVELSMSKLALLAATQQTQVKGEVAKKAIRATDRSAAILRIQDGLYEYVWPTIRDAIDSDAEALIIMGSCYKVVLAHQQCIGDFIKRNVARLVARDIIDPEDLIETLIYMEKEPDEDYDDYVARRFFLALHVLKYLDLPRSDPARHQLLESCIWRRCFIHGDWTSSNQTEDKDEQQAIAETESTALFTTAKELYANDLPLNIPSPTSLLEPGTTLASLRTSSRYASHPDSELTRLAKDLQHESRILKRELEKGRLEERYLGVIEAAKESVKRDREAELEMVKAQRIAEAENVRALKQRASGAGGSVNGERDGSAEMMVDGEGDVAMDG